MAEDNLQNVAAPQDADHLAHDHTHAEFHHHHWHGEHTHHAGGHHVLQVGHLSISFSMYDYSESYWSGKRVDQHVIDDLNISVHKGEILAVVGASGSGKTLLADAIMGLYASNSQVEGEIYFDGQLQTAESLAALRGREIAFVPQSVASLDPLMRVGKQIGASPEVRARLFERYGLEPEVEDLYPFQLSGGMARRVLLCTALASSPKLIIADEPTPGLDLDLAVRAMDDFRAFADEGGSVLLITHDVELALRVADRVAVFRGGTVVEETAVENFADPALLHHEFSRALWRALPEHDFSVEGVGVPGRAVPTSRSEGSFDDAPSAAANPGAPKAATAEGKHVLQVQDAAFAYQGDAHVFQGVDLTVESGERVCLQAPSGFGKTTLCRCLAGYLPLQQGQVLLDGQPLYNKKGALRLRGSVNPVQLVWQHPEAALDPRLRIRDSLAEAGPVDDALLSALGVRPEWLSRYPRELSGGEMQRCCIARALSCRPQFLIADEVSTMLDALTQVQVWNVLLDYCDRTGAGLIMVTHSPALARRLATRTISLD